MQNHSGTDSNDSPAYSFDGIVEIVNNINVVRLPSVISSHLSSRGQVVVELGCDGDSFTVVLEPDGVKGHWFRLDTLSSSAHEAGAGDTLRFTLKQSKNWPEPVVPDDFRVLLDSAEPDIKELWAEITPMARWEWVRWINETNNALTRNRRIQVSISKMDDGKRRPCCFNLAGCTDPQLSKSGKFAGLTINTQ